MLNARSYTSRTSSSYESSKPESRSCCKPWIWVVAAIIALLSIALLSLGLAGVFSEPGSPEVQRRKELNQLRQNPEFARVLAERMRDLRMQVSNPINPESKEFKTMKETWDTFQETYDLSDEDLSRLVEDETTGGRGFLFEARRGSQKLYLLGTCHPCAAFYREYLDSAVKSLVRQEGVKRVFFESDIPLELANGYENVLAKFEASMYLSLKEEFPNLDWKFLETSELVLEHAIEKVAAYMKPLDFYEEFYQLCSRIMKAAFVEGNPMDYVYTSGNEDFVCATTLKYASIPELGGANWLDLRNLHWVHDSFPGFSSGLNLDGDAPTTLLAVGAGHLYGFYGLPALLKREGWTVSHYDGFSWPYIPRPSTPSDFTKKHEPEEGCCNICDTLIKLRKEDKMNTKSA